MKLLIFAHTPPPHHGQSYMVQQMIEGFGGDCRKAADSKAKREKFGIECYHVNARFSKAISDIGGFQPRKFFLLVGYCLHAIWCRFRYGVTNFYYVPASGQRAALYRDWLVMLLCRPFYKKVALHWQAAGLTEWLETSTSGVTRWITHWLLGGPELSIVLSRYNIVDGQKMISGHVKMIHNGVPDPCPDFERDVLPRRLARFSARKKLAAGESLNEEERERAGSDPHILRLLYVAQCSREKGLFDLTDAVALANRRLEQTDSDLRVQLTVAGEFVSGRDKEEFEARIKGPDSQTRISSTQCLGGKNKSEDSTILRAVLYAGFLSGQEKVQAFKQSDCFCLPTYYASENQPVSLIEAMAFGLPIIATRWRSVPELFPPDYTGLVDIRSPQQIAGAISRILCEQSGKQLREIFISDFTLERHLCELREALWSLQPNS